MSNTISAQEGAFETICRKHTAAPVVITVTDAGASAPEALARGTHRLCAIGGAVYFRTGGAAVDALVVSEEDASPLAEGAIDETTIDPDEDGFITAICAAGDSAKLYVTPPR